MLLDADNSTTPKVASTIQKSAEKIKQKAGHARLKRQIFFYEEAEVPTTGTIVMTVTGTYSESILITGPSFAFFGVLEFFQEVVSGQEGVSCKHSRAGIAHNIPDAFSHFGFITMYTALRAGTLLGSKGTLVDSHKGILQQFFTIPTQINARGGMTGMAIYSYHGCQSLFFPF